jgi:hypothetical protein
MPNATRPATTSPWIVGAAETVKYPTGPTMNGRLTIDTVLRLEVTPKFGYVRRCDIVATPAPQPVD